MSLGLPQPPRSLLQPLTMIDSHIAADANSNGTATATVRGEARGVQHAEHGSVPSLFHRVGHTNSILALAVSNQCIFAGTQGGEILVGLPIFLM